MPENVYMYIRGHDIFDAVVSPLVSSVCEMLRREREREIHKLATNDKQLQNELSGYRHSTAPCDFMLKKQTGFYNAPQYEQILEKIKDFVERLKAEQSQTKIPAN